MNPPTRHSAPPRGARWLLGHLFPDDGTYTTLGDVEEVYHLLATAKGPRYARWWYRWQALSALPPYLYNVMYWGVLMLHNYLSIALRNLRKHKAYTLINVSGLGVGLACCLLIFLYVQDELSYDRHHENADRIYRVVADLKTPDQTFAFALTPPGIAPALREDFPDVLQTVRFQRTGGLYQQADRQFQENDAFYADSTVFEVFSFPFLRGNPETALKEPYSLVLTESTARKYFGDEDPLGKTLTRFGIEQPFTVTGLLADVPPTSHFTFDLLISLTTQEDLFPPTGPRWFNVNYYTYLLLADGSPPERLAPQLPSFVERHISEAQASANQYYTLFLQPVTDIHLNSNREVEVETNGNITYIYLFTAIAGFILLIACINFMNLSTARSADRAKEVGMRKVVGARRGQLVGQFLGEAIFLSFLALLVALLLSYLALPAFNTLSDKALTLTVLLQGPYGPTLLGVVLTVGLLAGSYPALVLSGFRPIAVLKGAFRYSRQGVLLRKGLVVFQFLTSIVLIVGTLVVSAQLTHLQNRNLGFDKEAMLVVNFRFDRTVQQQYERIKEGFLTHPAVTAAAASAYTPGTTPGNFYAEYEATDGETKNTSLHGYLIDYDFLDTYGLDLVAGRALSRDFGTDSTAAFLLNEAAVAYLGWEDPEQALGKRFLQFGKEGQVIGVVKDFHFRSLHREVEPLALHMSRGTLARFSLRLQTGSLMETVSDLEQIWRGLVPHRPFEYVFLDENLGQQYQAEARVGTLFTTFAGLAIFIACLGLFGLASFMAEQQKKALSIHKVMGASVGHLVLLFSRDYTRLVLIAFVLATPLAYLAMHQWLQGFPYRAPLTPWIFLGAGGLTLAITWLTVSYQSIKTALLNPVDTLRHE